MTKKDLFIRLKMDYPIVCKRIYEQLDNLEGDFCLIGGKIYLENNSIGQQVFEICVGGKINDITREYNKLLLDNNRVREEGLGSQRSYE